LSSGPGLPPLETRSEQALRQPAQLTRQGLAARHRLVVEDLAVQAGLEDALDARLQLQADQDGRPALEDLSRPPGGLVEVVSRDAVLDDDAVLRIDHL